MPALATPHYANVLLIGQDGKHLSTISTKKAKWYLKKNLAMEVPAPTPYARALQINFTHKQVGEAEKWDLEVSDNCCVMCGTSQDLTLHHIVPRVIRRYFPFEVKSHAREWCVLLCEPCHNNVEAVSQPVYKVKFPYSSPKDEHMDTALQVIKHKGNLHKIPTEKLAGMLALSSYKSVEEIPDLNPESNRGLNRELGSRRSNTQQRLIEEWAHEFIQEHGGIDGTHQYFYDLFLTFKPQYLPKWFLELRNK